MNNLSPLMLFAIGLVLIFIEVGLYSFFVIWFGIAFIVVAVLEYSYGLPSIWWQFAWVSVLALVLFALFYKPLKRLVSKNNTVKDDFIKQQGSGIIKNQMLNYQGSYFKVPDTDLSALEGKTVAVMKIEKNNAWINP